MSPRGKEVGIVIGASYGSLAAGALLFVIAIILRLAQTTLPLAGGVSPLTLMWTAIVFLLFSLCLAVLGKRS